MSDSNLSKIVLYSLAGFGVILSAAATVYLLTSKDDYADMGDFKSELANLGEIKMVKENGVSVIQFKQFIKITKIVYSCHERLSKKLREQFDNERRQLYIKKDWDAYEKYVSE